MWPVYGSYMSSSNKLFLSMAESWGQVKPEGETYVLVYQNSTSSLNSHLILSTILCKFLVKLCLFWIKLSLFSIIKWFLLNNCRWQQQFLEQLLKRIISRIKLSRKTEDEKKKMKGDIEERIKTLRHNIKQVGFNIVNCKMNAFFSFDLFTVYISECKQQLRTMKYYTQIRDIPHFKSGL